jgi:hypothetical protein
MLTLDQLEDLTRIFAVFTDKGWFIPHWLNDLRVQSGLHPLENTYYVCKNRI